MTERLQSREAESPNMNLARCQPPVDASGCHPHGIPLMHRHDPLSDLVRDLLFHHVDASLCAEIEIDF